MLTLEEYYVLLPEDLRTIDLWISKHEVLKKANEKAKAIIGVRREKGVIRRNFEPNKTTFCMHLYLDRWDEANKYHSKLKQEEEGNSNKIIYVRGERFPNSSLVPEIASPDLKKDEDDDTK